MKKIIKITTGFLASTILLGLGAGLLIQNNHNHLLIQNNSAGLQRVPQTTFILDQARLPKDVTFIKFNDYLKSNIHNEYGVQVGSSKGEYVDRILVTEGTMQIAKAGDIPPATEITSKPNSPVVSNSDVFLTDAKNADGDWDLNFLNKYISGLNTMPLSATIQDIIYIGENPGKLEWEIKVSGWYDGTSSTIQGEKQFTFYTRSYPYNETVITTKFDSPIVKNETSFIESIKNTDGSWNVTELSKYVNGLDTLPSGETVTDVAFIKSEGKILSFELTVSGWYDGIDNPIQPPKTFSFEVNSLPAETVITTKPDAPIIESETAFIESIKNTDGSWNVTELSKYINGLDTLPSTATILDVIFEKQNDDGTYEFKVKVSGWYNGSDDAIQPEKEFNFTVKNKVVVPPSTNDQFPWWWIIIGISGVGIAALATWLIIKKVKVNKIPPNNELE